MILAQILGNLGRDAEVKTINDKQYLSFSVASTEKENGEEVTRWVSVLSGNNPNVLPYLKKGQQVFVSGRYADKIYTNQNNLGIDRQLFAQTLQLCGGKREESKATQSSNPAPSATQSTTPSATPGQQQQTYPDNEPEPFTTEDGTDGLPF